MNAAQVSSILYLCVLLIFAVNHVWSDQFILKNSEDPEHPGMCHYKNKKSSEEISLYLSPGQEMKHPTDCYQLHCGEDLDIFIHGCGVAKGSKDCTFIPGNKTDPYPQCCGDFNCKKSN